MNDSIMEKLKSINAAVQAVIRTLQAEGFESAVQRGGAGDFTYSPDIHAEETVRRMAEEWAREEPLVLITEDAGRVVLPRGASEKDAKYILIVDPVDGSRNIMYDMRSAWIVTALAENHGAQTRLSNVIAAVQTELPTSKALYADEICFCNGSGTKLFRKNLMTGERRPMPILPSQAHDLRDGFCVFSKFFPGVKLETTELETRLYIKLGVDFEHERVFDDQYISSAGQLYLLLTGKYRFVADLRAWLGAASRSDAIALKPYDIGTLAAFRAAGIIVNAPDGSPLDAPLDVETKISFLAYANTHLRDLIQPKMLEILSQYSRR